ncbi:MAG TPA: DCC1-like thiol-disulfide oxidoreductase family protein [Rhizomicrobium sp.]
MNGSDLSDCIHAALPTKERVIIYDGDCPSCSNYVAFYRLKQTLGPIVLLNARDYPNLVRAFDQEGLNIDEGMAFIIDGRLYHGPDAMSAMAAMSSESGLFNRINATVFRHPRLTRFLYPILRAGRNATLRILGRAKLSGRD